MVWLLPLRPWRLSACNAGLNLLELNTRFAASPWDGTEVRLSPRAAAKIPTEYSRKDCRIRRPESRNRAGNETSLRGCRGPSVRALPKFCSGSFLSPTVALIFHPSR